MGLALFTRVTLTHAHTSHAYDARYQNVTLTLTHAHTSHAYDARYQYVTDVRNGSRGPLLAHGPWDAPSLHGKAWFIEDDTRTLLSTPPPSWCVLLTVPLSVLLTVNTPFCTLFSRPCFHIAFLAAVDHSLTE
jgi:hypothetical protein